jgi:hypothetical protein
VAKDIENWNERLKMEVIKFCEENNFNTGFFDGIDSNLAVDAYELKVFSHNVISMIKYHSHAYPAKKLFVVPFARQVLRNAPSYLLLFSSKGSID